MAEGVGETGRWLLKADAGELGRPPSVARDAHARQARAAAWRVHRQLAGATPEERASLLEMAARSVGADWLAEELARIVPERPWACRWGRWPASSPHRMLPGHPDVAGWPGEVGVVWAVATAAIDGRPVVVSGGDDDVVRVTDLATGALLRTLARHRSQVRAVETAVLGGRPVAVSGGGDGTVRLWDLTTGDELWAREAHRGWISRLAIGEVDGAPVVVTAGDRDRRVRVWDLRTGSGLLTLRRRRGTVRWLAVAELDGRPVAAAGIRATLGGGLFAWDLRTGARVRRPPRGSRDPRWSGSVGYGQRARIDGRMVRVSVEGLQDDNALTIRDARMDDLLGVLTGHTGEVESVVTADVDGQPVAVSGGRDGTVRVWDLADAVRREAPADPRGPLCGIAVDELDGRGIVVAYDWRGRVRDAWDLGSGVAVDTSGTGSVARRSYPSSLEAEEGEFWDRPVVGRGPERLRVRDPRTGAPLMTFRGPDGWDEALAVGELEGAPVVVSGGSDEAVRVWDPESGAEMGAVTGAGDEVHAVAIGEVDGGPVVLAGGSDGRVQVWDLRSGVRLMLLTDTGGSVSAIGVGAIEGRPVAVSGDGEGTLRVWDLRTAACVRRLRLGPGCRLRTIASDGGIVVVTDDGAVFVLEVTLGSTQAASAGSS